MIEEISLENQYLRTTVQDLEEQVNNNNNNNNNNNINYDDY
jgi:hypothetical protein